MSQVSFLWLLLWASASASGVISPKVEHDERIGRIGSAIWDDIDADAQWAFGGRHATSLVTFTNDLWHLNRSVMHWDYVFGRYSNATGRFNWPGSRAVTCAWSLYNSSMGRATHWLFGGEGFSSDPAPGLLADLWQFFPQNLFARSVSQIFCKTDAVLVDRSLTKADPYVHFNRASTVSEESAIPEIIRVRELDRRVGLFIIGTYG